MGQARGTMYYVVRGILVLGPLGWQVGAIQIGMGVEARGGKDGGGRERN